MLLEFGVEALQVLLRALQLSWRIGAARESGLWLWQGAGGRAERAMEQYVVTNVVSLAEHSVWSARFAAAHRLRHLVWEGRPAQVPAGPNEDPARPLLWATVVRAIKTFSAVLVLCDKGFGEQAAMLCRSLFEDFAVSRWIAAHPNEVRQRFLEHGEQSRVQHAEKLIEHDLGRLAMSPPLTDAQRRDTGRAHRHWTQRTVHQLLRESEKGLDEVERKKMWRMHDLSHRINNLLLHHTPLSLDQIAYGETLTIRRSERNVDDSLQSAYYSLSRLALVVLSDPARGEVLEAIREDEPIFSPLPERPRGIGRNDPCPCGSGRKYKQCHGR